MEQKSLRKKKTSSGQLENTAYIFSVVNDDFEVNKVLSNCSDVLFSLDKESKYILEILSKNGPLSEYQISKIGNNYNLSRDSIRRRILGTNTFPSLLEHDFIQIVRTEKHRTGKEIKNFGLTFKGLLAALSRMKFEEIYLSKKYYSEMKGLLGDKLQNLVELASLYTKYHVALMMLWCKLNNLNLLQNNNINNFFLEGITNHYLSVGFLSNVDNDYEWDNYTNVGIRYFVLKHTLFSLVRNLPANVLSHLYFDRRTKHVFQNLKQRKRKPKEFFVRYLIKDWLMNLELISLTSIDKDGLIWIEYGNDRPLDHGMFWQVNNQEKADELYSKIAKKLSLRKSSVKIMSYYKYEK